MLIEHGGRAPTVHPDATVSATAVLSGDVRVGARTSIAHGAVLTAESGPVVIGDDCIVMETAVIRGTSTHPATVGNRVLLGPGSHITGCTIGDESFLATHTSVFTTAVLGRGCEVRINAIVHIKTVLPAGSMVPIGWVAVGDPASILSPDRHDEIWEIQSPLDFPGLVFGAARPGDGETLLASVAPRYAGRLGRLNRDDAVIEP